MGGSTARGDDLTSVPSACSGLTAGASPAPPSVSGPPRGCSQAPGCLLSRLFSPWSRVEADRQLAPPEEPKRPSETQREAWVIINFQEGILVSLKSALRR